MKRIFVVGKEWTKEDMEELRKQINNNEFVIIGGDIQVFAIKKDELFEVVNDLKKIGKIEYIEMVEEKK